MNLWFCWERSIRRLMRISEPRIGAAIAEMHVDLQHGAALADLTSLGIGGATDLLPIKKNQKLSDPPNLPPPDHIPHQILGRRPEPLPGHTGPPGAFPAPRPPAPHLL